MPDPKKAPQEELRFNAGLLKRRIVFQILSILPNGTNDIESNTNFDELSSDEIMLRYELESEFEKLEGKYDETGFIGKNQSAKNITIYSTDEGAEALRQYRWAIVRQIRSQIFRQIA